MNIWACTVAEKSDRALTGSVRSGCRMSERAMWLLAATWTWRSCYRSIGRPVVACAASPWPHQALDMAPALRNNRYYTLHVRIHFTYETLLDTLTKLYLTNNIWHVAVRVPYYWTHFILNTKNLVHLAYNPSNRNLEQ